MKFLVITAIALAASASLANAQAPAFPNKPIRIVIPYAPGGGATIITRALQQGMGDALGVTVLVDNKPGGATKVGTVEVARSAPDGYTLIMNPPIAWVGYYYSKTYDTKPWEDFTPIAQFAETPYNFIATSATSGLDTWAKVVAKAKGNPGTIKVGGPAAGGLVEFTFNQIMERAGITGIYVPFQGSQPALTALLGGHIDFQITTLGDGMAATRQGQTHALAVSSEGRAPSAPEVPTFAELGMGDTLTNTFSIFGPKGMDPKVVDILAAAIRKAIQDPKYVELLAKRDYAVVFKSGAEVRDALNAFDARWGPRLAASFK